MLCAIREPAAEHRDEVYSISDGVRFALRSHEMPERAVPPPSSALILEIALDDPATEPAFIRWWQDAASLLARRFRAETVELHVAARGRYVAIARFSLVGSATVVIGHPEWQELEAQRPGADVAVSQTRIWHAGGNPRDMTTTELVEWIAARDARQLDFVLIDTLPPSSFALEHLSGAVNLRLDPRERFEMRARELIGADLDRRVVTYCSGYA